ncbi:hypothetical protein WMY93_006468 [Mugilogobius chulae]|uniref:Immunoglobulin domain-containing protein n=1 Tax=Mugilogobius chulae TaxID=88201 RepID=A0AAW0PRB3_9GOBI
MGPDIRLKQPGSLCLALVLCSCVLAKSEVEVIHAKAGSTVTFKSKPSADQKEQVLWTFGASKPVHRIAKISSSKVHILAFAQFEGRLHVDNETGDLTVSDLTVNDTGVYQLQRIHSHISEQFFNLTVYSKILFHLPNEPFL